MNARNILILSYINVRYYTHQQLAIKQEVKAQLEYDNDHETAVLSDIEFNLAYQQRLRVDITENLG